ncbi:site-specific integrase [Nitratidesulfovibrio sp. D1]|uniref:site-specific integrase n=1 Tax=Nitratidesulfovibrio sp. D1 TaxID=3440151 RepID=UPI003EC002B8
MSDPTNPDEFLTDAKIRELADRALDDGLKATREQRLKGVRSEGRLLAQLDAHELLASDSLFSMAVNEPGFGLDRYKGMALGLLGECGMSEVDEAGTQFLKLCHALAAVDHVINVAAQATVFTGRLNRGQRALYEELVGVDAVATVQEVAPSNGVVLSSTVPAMVKNTPPLPDAIAAFIKAKEGIDWTVKSTVDDNTTALSMFTAICRESAAADVRVASITRELIRSYAKVVDKLPPRASDKHGKGATYKQIADGNKGKVLSVKRKAWVYDAIRTFLRWAGKEYGFDSSGLVDELPKVKPLPKGPHHMEGDRRGFTLAELRTLFSADNFLNVWSETRGGDKPERFWCPLIGLFTGMRLGEICQLRPVDIRIEHCEGVEEGASRDVLIFDVNAKDGKRLKRGSTARYVPVHPFLVELGLLHYVEALSDPSGFIFPNLRVVPGEQPGHAVGSWWTDYRRLCGVGGMVDEKSEVVFHTLRNTFISARFTGKFNANREYVQIVAGHQRSDMTARYEDQLSVATLYDEVISRYTFHDLIPLHPLKANPWAQKG